MPLKRRKHKSTKERPQIRSRGHLQWIRGHYCAVENAECHGKIEAHHVRLTGDGGTSLKPGDNCAVPLCGFHHREIHNLGQRSFDRKYKVNLASMALELWLRSKHRLKYEATKTEA